MALLPALCGRSGLLHISLVPGCIGLELGYLGRKQQFTSSLRKSTSVRLEIIP
jgi:hypothetical protein